MKAGDGCDQIAPSPNRGNPIELRLEYRDTLCLDLSFIHARGVEIAELFFELAALGIGGGRALTDRVQLLAVSFGQLGEARPRRLICGRRVVLYPVAARVLIKVNARLRGLIQVADRKASRGVRLGGRGRLSGNGGSDQEQNAADSRVHEYSGREWG